MKRFNLIQHFGQVMVVLLLTFLASCGGGSSVTNNPNPGIGGNTNNPGVNNPGGGNGNGGSETITVEQRYPAPYESGKPKDFLIHQEKYKLSGNLSQFEDRSASAVINMDSEVMYPTLNATAVLMYNQQNSTKTFNGGLGNWDHSFLWNSTDANANRNTQGVTWLGLINADKLHDIYDGATQIDSDIAQAVTEVLDTTDPDGAGPLLGSGFIGNEYLKARAADDTSSATSADRPFAYEVVLCSRAANYLNNPQYDVMAQTWFEGTTDELTGIQEVDRLLTAGRASLTLWDCESRIRAAAVTYNYDWAEDIITQLDNRRNDWDGVLVGGWDYTPLGWEAIGGAIAELKFNAGTLSPLAQSYLDESYTKLKGNPNHHQVLGYYGFEQGGRTFDDSQQNGYAMLTIAHGDFFDLNGSDTTLLSRGNRALEYYKKNVLAYSQNFNLDGIAPNNDAGAILDGYRGPIIIGSRPFNYEVGSEWLNGASDLSSRIDRYPNIPLY